MFIFRINCSFQIYIGRCHCYSYTKELNLNNGKLSPRINWDLNWLSQDDPKLIEFIKENLLIPPNASKEGLKLRNQYNDNEPWKHQGQNGEALIIEYVLELNKKRQNSGKFNINVYI